jgi:hypothetical protein
VVQEPPFIFKAGELMDSITIKVTYHPNLPEEENVFFKVEDEKEYPLLHNYTMDEIAQLNDDQLHGIMAGLISVKAIFDEAIHLRDCRQVQIAKEMEQLLGEPVYVKTIPIGIPSRKVKKHESDGNIS